MFNELMFLRSHFSDHLSALKLIIIIRLKSQDYVAFLITNVFLPYGGVLPR